MLKQLVLGGAMVLATTLSVQAQRIVDGTSVDEILKIARSYGAAELESESGYDPRIQGEIEGIKYYATLMNCTNNANCEDLNFWAAFVDNKQTLEVINAWNRDKRFGRAYLDSDLDATIDWDVNLEYGVTRDNLDANFGVWALILSQFATYVGYK